MTACGLALSACAGPSPVARAAPVRSLSPADRLWLAEEILIARCMAAHGFTYVVTSPAAPAQVPEFPYGLNNLDRARAHGYGFADRPGSPPSSRTTPTPGTSPACPLAGRPPTT